MTQTLPLGKKDMPEALPLHKLIGPSFIILGLGLGSGEIVLWPYMASTYGLGVVWGIVIGITMQFFINMEVERYALCYGESIFVGFARLLKFLPLWFIVSTFLGFGWPGIGLYGATLLNEVFGFGNPNMVGVVLFVAIGLILTLGTSLYKTVETLQKYLIGIGVPFIVILTFFMIDGSDLVALGKGLIGHGMHDGAPYRFLPEGIVFGSFLGALAYAGAGGNLNLTQSCYVRDKGYGMGKYANKITSLITGKGSNEAFSLTGNTFEPNAGNLRRFRQWWNVINKEHAMIFWGIGLFTMLMLSLLAYATTYGHAGSGGDIAFVIRESVAIGEKTLPIFGSLFLIVTGIMLTATQLTVLDSTSRIITENALLLRLSASRHGECHPEPAEGRTMKVSLIYYIVLWAQIAFGITIFLIGFDRPLTLIILGAMINAFSMFIYTGLLLWANFKLMPKGTRPSPFRTIVMMATFGFLGWFCWMTLIEKVMG